MRIGIVIGRIGGIDGVALETEKWITVLERMGHEVQVLAGALEGPVSNVTLLPELAFDHPLAVEDQELAFFDGHVEEAELLKRLDEGAATIAAAIKRWVVAKDINCLLSENANAIPLHLTMGMALRQVFDEAGIPAVTHDHDFAWERGDRYQSSFDGVNNIVETCFPVREKNVRHAVINSAAKVALEERYGIGGTIVVPNVMDFDEPLCRGDHFNEDLPASLGFSVKGVNSDIVMFQITRIVRRKGIEIALELVDRLKDPRMKLVITGTSADDRNDTYTAELEAKVEQLGLGEHVLFAGDRFGNVRGTNAKGQKVYTLWDAYLHARACTYFSLYEGFGNAFVEAVVAKVPIFVNNYKPVYWPDIGSKGFRTVMLEDGVLTDEAVNEARWTLEDPVHAREIARHNFDLGQQYFSYQALQGLLTELFGGV